ncbi:hypothetical protein HDU99_006660 [Rhizoclosmatium hyalinum]|nr:hypothetical protein HDU99_006660 [Rhizoclosmatium hyalinum]
MTQTPSKDDGTVPRPQFTISCPGTVETSSHAPRMLHAAVLVAAPESVELRQLSIVAELRGVVETKWADEAATVPANYTTSTATLVRRSSIFLEATEVVCDQMTIRRGAQEQLDFVFALPMARSLPPSLRSSSGNIKYSLIARIRYENGAIVKTEIEQPFQVIMSEQAKVDQLESPSDRIIEQSDPSMVEFTMHIDRCILAVGDAVEAEIEIRSTQGAYLQAINAVMQPYVSYSHDGDNSYNVLSSRPQPRFLQRFQNIQVTPENPLRTQLSLEIDNFSARPSFTSELISATNILHVEIILDDEAKSFSQDFILTILPPPKNGVAVRKNERTNTEPSNEPYTPPNLVINTGSSRSRRPTGLVSSPIDIPAPQPTTLGAPATPTSLHSLSLDRNSNPPDTSFPTAANSMHSPPQLREQLSFTTRSSRRGTTSPATPISSSPLTAGTPVFELKGPHAPPPPNLPDLPRYEVHPPNPSRVRDSPSSSTSTGIVLVPKEARSWSAEMVLEWARQMNLPAEVIDLFDQHQIEGVALLTLDDSDLKDELKIMALGVRRKIIVGINTLRDAVSNSWSPGSNGKSVFSVNIIGRGANAGPDGTIVVDGGWDTEASLEGTADKVGFSLHIPQRIVTIGDSVELHVTINSTPQDARLRMLNCQLRNVVSCLNSEGFAVQQKFPRPLSEVSQPFNLVSVTPGYSDPIVRRLYFTVDPQIALQSLESPLVSSRSILRVQIVLDTSETPNVSMEIPIVVVPRNTEGYEPPGVASSGTSQYSVMATPILRATTIQSPQLNPNNENGSSGGSFLDILASPPQSPQRMTSQGGMSARFGPTAPTASSTVTSSPTTKLTSEKSPSSLPSPGSEIPATNTFARMTLGAQSPVLSDSRYAQPVSANSRSNLTPSNLVYEAPTLNRSTPVPQTNVYASSSNGRGIAAPNNVVYDIPTLIPPRTPTLNRSTPVPPSPVGMNLHVPPSPSARATPTNMMQIPQQPIYQIPQEAQGTQLNMTWDEKRAPILQQQQQLLEQQRHLQQQQQLLEQQLRLQQQQHALEQQLLLQQQQHQLEQEQQHYQPSWEEKRSQPVVSQRREWEEPIAAPAYTASPPTISSVDKESLSSGFRSMVAEWDVEKVADWAKTLGATADSIQKYVNCFV